MRFLTSVLEVVAEKVIQKTLPEATIVRPGAMFGPGDALFGTLADLSDCCRYCR